MNMSSLTRGALLGSACALLAMAGSASAQTYPPGTNCQSLLPNLRTACVNQARSMNSGTGVIPNSAGSNTVAPGTNGLDNNLNTGTTVIPNAVSPNAVTPNGTINPNAVTPNGTINPNAVGMPNQAPTGTQIIIPPAGTGTTNGIGTTGTGTGALGTGTRGTTGN